MVLGIVYSVTAENRFYRTMIHFDKVLTKLPFEFSDDLCITKYRKDYTINKWNYFPTISITIHQHYRWDGQTGRRLSSWQCSALRSIVR